MHELMTLVGWAFALLGCGYALVAVVASLRPPRSWASGHRAPVTVLKPLCGVEPELELQLRSFCTQDYPQFQLVFGLQDPNDPALETVRRLQRDYPALEIDLVIDTSRHGTNAKVSNLINMLPRARHDVLLIADSDITVPREHFARVVDALDGDQIGLVTCCYRGAPRRGAPSALGALFINDWFVPSVRVAELFGSQGFVSGATMALRREVLQRAGGFAPLADQLADDFKLGAQVRALGLRIVVANSDVDTVVAEASFTAWWQHSLRWLRTIRAVQPLGYALCFPTFSIPLVLLGAGLAGPPAWGVVAITVGARLVLHFHPSRGGARARWLQLALLLPHDVLLLALWCWSFSNREVMWRQERFGVGRDGSLRRVG